MANSEINIMDFGDIGIAQNNSTILFKQFRVPLDTIAIVGQVQERDHFGDAKFETVNVAIRPDGADKLVEVSFRIWANMHGSLPVEFRYARYF